MTDPERRRRVEDLCDAALNHDARERVAFVAAACGGDEALRQEVEALLAHAQTAEGFLAAQMGEVAARVLGDEYGASLVGRQVGAYQIVSDLGTGGMGVVYRAFDTRLNRPVAVKVLSDDLADAAARRRFQREAQTASSLNHPHILTVLDAGELEGRQYLVTEFVDGGTLRDWSREKRTWRQLVDLLVGVADGLAAAHDAGILHRDIKPENILVAKNGYAKLADFGLAKLLERSGEAPVTGSLTEGRTRPGVILGTIAYMSPEQASGQLVDARSDIFSFGVVMYEMVAGRRPFAESSDLEVLQTVIHAAPPPLGADVPVALRTVVEKALEKDPSDRYQSMRDMVVDLRRLTRQTIETPSRAVPQARLPWRWAAATILALLAAVAAWKFWPQAGPHQIHSIAVLPLQNLSRDPEQQYLTDGMTEALTTDLAQISGLNVIGRTSVMRYQATQKTTSEIARELHVDTLVEGAVQRSGNRVLITAQLIEGSSDRHLWAKSYDRDGRDALALQAEVAQAIAAEIQVKLTPQEKAHLASPHPVNPEAQEAYLKGRYWSKKDDIGKAFDYYQQAIQRDPNYAAAYAALGDNYGYAIYTGFVSATEGKSKWRAAVTKALELDETLAEAHASLAALLQYRDGNVRDAEREYERALQLNPNLPVHSNHSDGLRWTGRLEEAVAESRQAQRLDPYDRSATFTLGKNLIAARRNDEAIEEGRKMLEWDALAAHWMLGRAYEQKGDLDQAISEFQQSIRLVKGDRSLAAATGYIVGPTSDLAHAFALSGRTKEAVQLLAELTELSRHGRVESWAFAIVYTGLRDKDRAFEWLEKGVDEELPNDILEIKADPRMAPLRFDPRYRPLLRRLGLPE